MIVRVSLNEGQGPGQKGKTFEYVKPPSYLRSHEKILIGVAAKGGKQGFTCSEDSECFKVGSSISVKEEKKRSILHRVGENNEYILQGAAKSTQISQALPRYALILTILSVLIILNLPMNV
ncbi:hypothetical protein Bca52824_021537 [Brassica carinata]|uniref:Uncharacterized protein n=1 Tax=Brassica carinata TaxID=52824 RepID=A0A8X7VEH2_BRACI|nr:hypothetical protein Bca52824_021537 [Brassica carinata]